MLPTMDFYGWPELIEVLRGPLCRQGYAEPKCLKWSYNPILSFKHWKLSIACALNRRSICRYLQFRPRRFFHVFFPEPRHKRTCPWLRFPGVGAQCQGPTGLAAGPSNFKGWLSMCFHWFHGTTRLTTTPAKNTICLFNILFIMFQHVLGKLEKYHVLKVNYGKSS